ncbi:MAG: hypothetical protein RBT45_07765, partial [Acholeplasmataceae bacterium]|nr:hypothetical protein [Acholeplasmataceae bacterium]
KKKPLNSEESTKVLKTDSTTTQESKIVSNHNLQKNNSFLVDSNEEVVVSILSSRQDKTSTDIYLTDKRLYVVGKVSQGKMTAGHGVTFFEKSSIFGATKTSIKNYALLVYFFVELMFAVSLIAFGLTGIYLLGFVVLLLASLITLIVFLTSENKMMVIMYQGGNYSIDCKHLSRENFEHFFKSLGAK